MRVFALIALCLAASAFAFVVDYHEYPAQIDEWERSVQARIANPPSSDREEEDFVSSPFSDGPTKDDFELDEDMQLGSAEDADDGLDISVNLSLSESDADDVAAHAAMEEADSFDRLDTVGSRFPTRDYIDMRVPDDAHYSQETGGGKARYLAVTRDEVKDAIALIQRLYTPHATVQGEVHDSKTGSATGVIAEFYIQKHLAESVAPGVSAAGVKGSKVVDGRLAGQVEKDEMELARFATVNLDMADVEQEANKDWALVQKHFHKLAKDIQTSSRKGMANVANWASIARNRLDQTVGTFKAWARDLHRSARKDWRYVELQANAAGKMIEGLLICPASKKTTGNGAAAVSFRRASTTDAAAEKAGTAFVVLRAHDDVTDWIQSFQHEQVPCTIDGCRGKVHHGFKKCYDSIRNAVMHKIAALHTSHNINRVVVTGYSLGGALSLLLSTDGLANFPPVSVGVATFGQPKVGDAQFAQYVDMQLPKYARVVAKFEMSQCNCETEVREDYVTSLPEKQGFVHAGMEVGVPCFAGQCNTRCCPQTVIHQIKCHSLDRYLHSTWSALA